jgi:S1-C subfamily serine protease
MVMAPDPNHPSHVFKVLYVNIYKIENGKAYYSFNTPTDVTVAGNSGGGLFNFAGELIGIHIRGLKIGIAQVVNKKILEDFQSRSREVKA